MNVGYKIFLINIESLQIIFDNQKLNNMIAPWPDTPLFGDDTLPSLKPTWVTSDEYEDPVDLIEKFVRETSGFKVIP